MPSEQKSSKTETASSVCVLNSKVMGIACCMRCQCSSGENPTTACTCAECCTPTCRSTAARRSCDSVGRNSASGKTLSSRMVDCSTLTRYDLDLHSSYTSHDAFGCSHLWWGVSIKNHKCHVWETAVSELALIHYTEYDLHLHNICLLLPLRRLVDKVMVHIIYKKTQWYENSIYENCNHLLIDHTFDKRSIALSLSSCEICLNCIRMAHLLSGMTFTFYVFLVIRLPQWARGNPPLSHHFPTSLSSSLSFSIFSFFPFLIHVLLAFHPFRFYQNSPTPFPRPDVIGGD